MDVARRDVVIAAARPPRRCWQRQRGCSVCSHRGESGTFTATGVSAFSGTVNVASPARRPNWLPEPVTV
jgi:hypothetical protein